MKLRSGPGFWADLEAMSDDELVATIDHSSNNVVFGLSFWVDELNRRRWVSTLDRMAEAGAEAAEHAAESGRYSASMHKLTWAMAVLTAVNVALAAISVIFR
jgi:hypothetical protein